MSKTMTSEELQADFANVLDEMRENFEEVLVTKGGKTVAKLTPVDEMRGPMWGKIKILGDIIEPVDEWDCEK
ncbi:MAG TPA: type II toxin-antitoxin system prevent-host-death family antitoxin [Thermoanaerobaculia bacterium]|jgi:prevent-host-death family protein